MEVKHNNPNDKMFWQSIQTLGTYLFLKIVQVKSQN